MHRRHGSSWWLGLCLIGCADADVSDDAPSAGLLEQAVVGDAIADLTGVQALRFQAGRESFDETETIEEGLGPIFNERSCGRCHSVGGLGGSGTQFEQRAGRVENGVFNSLEQLGGQLFERFTVMNLTGKERNNIPDCALKKNGEDIPIQATVKALRRTTALFGLGLVDNTPDSVFINFAQAQLDADPEVAGHVNMVANIVDGGVAVGKFGWKSQVPSVLQFSGDAYLNEMGITNRHFPHEQAPLGMAEFIPACDLIPEVNNVLEDQYDTDVQAFTDFMQMLAPVPPLAQDAKAMAGSQLFDNTGCAFCHVRDVQSGTDSSFSALNGQTYHPFSDFLLHDMGSLGDGIGGNGTAGLTEMRTAPLWGLRLLDAKHQLLHDGRATSLPDAILRHDGQAKNSRDKFAALSKADQDKLLAFLKTL